MKVKITGVVDAAHVTALIVTGVHDCRFNNMWKLAREGNTFTCSHPPLPNECAYGFRVRSRRRRKKLPTLWEGVSLAKKATTVLGVTTTTEAGLLICNDL
jgi:hypothetical protein